MSDRDVDDVIGTIEQVLRESRPKALGVLRRVGEPEAGEYIAIVSGLPRSGTSMLMKMLDAGGLPPLTDGVRSADEDNPGGYYEFEQVKQLTTENQWLESAAGKAVKIISQLLADLPADKQYRIVFALRDMGEILASQRAMLQRRGQGADGVDDAEIAAVFGRHLNEVRAWLQTQEHMAVLYVDYADILRDPLAESGKIEAFLGRSLDVQRMAVVVDDNLYRQRK